MLSSVPEFVWHETRKNTVPIRMNEQQKQVRDHIVQAAKQSTNATLRNLDLYRYGTSR